MTEGATMDIFQGITDGVTHLLEWAGLVINSLLTTSGELNPLAALFFISLAGSALFLGVKLIKGFTWGA